MHITLFGMRMRLMLFERRHTLAIIGHRPAFDVVRAWTYTCCYLSVGKRSILKGIYIRLRLCEFGHESAVVWV